MTPIEFEDLVHDLKKQGVEVDNWKAVAEIIENHDDYDMVRGYIEVDEIDSDLLHDVFEGLIVHIVPGDSSYIQISIYHEVEK